MLQPTRPFKLVVDVPGARFPAFTAVRVPTVTPLGGIAPGRAASHGAAVTDTFTWQAADDPLAVVRFDFLIAVGDPTDDACRDLACQCLVRALTGHGARSRSSIASGALAHVNALV